MSWVLDEQRKIVEHTFSSDSKWVELPENGGTVSLLLKVNTPPTISERDSKKTPGSKYTVYEFTTSDGKTLTCYRTLYKELVNALAPFAEKIESSGTEYVSCTIVNKGTLQKPNWFVIIGGGL